MTSQIAPLLYALAANDGVPKGYEESGCEHYVRSIIPSRLAVNRKQRRKLGDKSRRENHQHDSIGYKSSLLANSSKLSGRISNTTHPS
jgi:hypothetical protein